jgi:hypothetical protein
MSTKIKLYDEGDCVEVTVWNHNRDDFFTPAGIIGLILEAELVTMDVDLGDGLNEKEEWMYRVSIPNGKIVEAWDYEIKPVNVMGKEYNNISHQPEGE